MWIKRHNKGRLEKAVKERPVVFLTGVRQAGKSSLLQNLFSDADYVTLDKLLYAEEAEINPSKFLNRFKSQTIIDEIQYAPSLFRELKIRVDEDRATNGKWILTGSQHFVLMKNLSESLAGRIRILTLGTLKADELINAGLLNERRDLLWKGGFPEIWAQNLETPDFFEDYIQTYLERDLRQVLQVTNLRDFRRFMSLLALRTGQLINYSEISKELGMAVNTIKSWVNTLEISGIIILLPPYYKNVGKRLIKSPKLYWCDNGLVSSLLNIHSLNALENSVYKGNIWENFVFTEYLKAGYVPGKDLFYYRDQNGVEIDFILEREGKIILVEAKNHERPDSRKLNFNKVAPLFKENTVSVLACGVNEQGRFDLKDYSVYNPLFGDYL
ncbi:MAG: ATP-binding protein [Bacteroidales bacterium]|nr:ATP-binding protein [Bacteroidales bacterium]MCF8334918.1 ATP-binding protein [Bacteroidales bacterium]